MYVKSVNATSAEKRLMKKKTKFSTFYIPTPWLKGGEHNGGGSRIIKRDFFYDVYTILNRI